jgi:hypothetical protein
MKSGSSFARRPFISTAVAGDYALKPVVDRIGKTETVSVQFGFIPQGPNRLRDNPKKERTASPRPYGPEARHFTAPLKPNTKHEFSAAARG